MLKNIVIVLIVMSISLHIISHLSEEYLISEGSVIAIDQEIDRGLSNRISKFLKSNSGNDVTIRIRSIGGSRDAMLGIVRSMQQFRGSIHVEIYNYCYSACAVIATYANSVDAKPGSHILYHMPRYTSITGKLVILRVNHPDRRVRVRALGAVRFYNKRIKYMLTKREYASMIKGKDIVLDANTFERRHKRLSSGE